MCEDGGFAKAGSYGRPKQIVVQALISTRGKAQRRKTKWSNARATYVSGDAQVALVRQRVNAVGGHATLVRGSDELRRNVDVFHPQPAGLAALSERVRQSFDPKNILNRGRMGRNSAT